jgi:hypothetical protein
MTGNLRLIDCTGASFRHLMVPLVSDLVLQRDSKMRRRSAAAVFDPRWPLVDLAQDQQALAGNNHPIAYDKRAVTDE